MTGMGRDRARLADLTEELDARLEEISDADARYHIRQAAQRLVIAEQELDERST